MRPALPLLLLFASAAAAQLPSDGKGTAYARDNRIHIPFDLQPRDRDRATKIVLYSSFNGGDWQEYESVRAGGKREFVYRADREGAYSFATMTHFDSGPSDPARKDDLKEQKRVIYDRTPPRITSVRAVTSTDGAPGIEWDVADENMHPRGVKLEFRWDRSGRFEPIDKAVPFSARDSRYWKLEPRDRMQVRVVATDWAGNKTESEPVWVSGRDADRAEPVARPGGGGGLRDAAVTPAGGPLSTLHYVNDKERKVTLNVNALVGPSGLKKATLWWADEKLVWAPWKDVKGPLAAPASTTPDAPRKIPVDFTFIAPKDGLYHFVVVIENHREASRPDPKTGAVGEVQVMVDTTKPDVKLQGEPRVSSNGDRGAVVDIKWTAKDPNIAPLPIKLEYRAVHADKPGEAEVWKAITADWIDNTGQYTWSPPTGEAHEFHIKVTCRDRAGNDNSEQTTRPINVDLTKPGVEAVEVKPGASAIEVLPSAPPKG